MLLLITMVLANDLFNLLRKKRKESRYAIAGYGLVPAITRRGKEFRKASCCLGYPQQAIFTVLTEDHRII
ncbi:hypothetical protein WB66_06360 [bacteria symbiont BFo1 of Frankliniella occidentalis]|nr:hypothetical protein AI28_21810 [bacteria symbiont BFo1 of Frankliniella occidentalis]KYP85610.1 hypothetical protein WB66_06360 [bacteria symbiont BFo1 of Frankliniella occidentalis]